MIPDLLSEGFRTGRISELKAFLDAKVSVYNQPEFTIDDPVGIPHRFTKKQDIEIAAFFAAILAWGQRKTILNKTTELLLRMDNDPHNFMLHHSDKDLQNLLGFKHRTFNETDLLYFVSFFKFHYLAHTSLEDAFIPTGYAYNPDYTPEGLAEMPTGFSSTCYAGEMLLSVESALNYFRAYFFSLEYFPQRTVKHISSPMQKSTCKRLNMFLRWMVRKDDKGVDFGLWNTLRPAQLICPCDVHVLRVARRLGLISRTQTDWLTAVELTTNLRKLDPVDPVRYDFALFGMGVVEKYAPVS